MEQRILILVQIQRNKSNKKKLRCKQTNLKEKLLEQIECTQDNNSYISRALNLHNLEMQFSNVSTHEKDSNSEFREIKGRSLTCQRPEDRKDRNQMKDDRQQKIDRGDLTDQRIKFSDTPLEQVQNIVENNMFANERKHSEKKSAECTDERAALANLIAI
ncbi:hypothetical protein Tco_1501765 [Tanacetum coccineum]